jgi:hypothetical protein
LDRGILEALIPLFVEMAGPEPGREKAFDRRGL